MDLAGRLKEGSMPVAEFFGVIVGQRAWRTHVLKKGDYLVGTCFGRDDVVRAERLAKLDSPEIGDFRTVGGTTGPISGNVFIKINPKGEYPPYMLVEGDRIGEPNCPAPVYGLVSDYLKRRCA